MRMNVKFANLGLCASIGGNDGPASELESSGRPLQAPQKRWWPGDPCPLVTFLEACGRDCPNDNFCLYFCEYLSD